MLQNQIDENGALPLANAIGFVLGFMGVIAFFIQQSLTVFLPLLMPPTVCLIFCTLLYKTHRRNPKLPRANPRRARFGLTSSEELISARTPLADMPVGFCFQKGGNHVTPKRGAIMARKPEGTAVERRTMLSYREGKWEACSP